MAIKDAPWKVGKGSPGLGKLSGSLMAVLPDELHDLSRKAQAFF
jgi:hypothetical protein